MSFLTGKKVVVMGVANKRSIAWGRCDLHISKRPHEKAFRTLIGI